MKKSPPFSTLHSQLSILLLLCLGVMSTAKAQDLSIYEKKQFIAHGDTLNYRLLLPVDYNPEKAYPLVLFLHGAGERGNDNERQLIHGGKFFADEATRKKFPAIILFPQCPEEDYWANTTKEPKEDGGYTFKFSAGGEPTKALSMAQELLAASRKSYKVDPQRIYITGLSMGGMGTFELLWRNPKTFAAAAPICGGANVKTAKKYAKNTAVWIFHGGKDNVVLPTYSREMHQALEKAGCNVKYTEYPEANHNSWDAAFAEPEFLPWMFSRHLGKRKKVGKQFARK